MDGMRPNSVSTIYTLIPPRESTITYFNYKLGDVIAYRTVTFYKEAITLPFGTFQQYATYIEDEGSHKDSVIIVPGVGIVYRVMSGIESPSNLPYVTKSFLQKYKLVNK